MLALIATMKVQAGKEAEFEKVFLALAKEVRAKEPGNHLYTLTKDSDGTYHVLEIYEDQAALDAVKQWQFTPTLLNGVPVPVIMTVTVNFTLQ